MPSSHLESAAEAIAAADAILIGAGAGMGVDSGLPDFRGDEGFWKAYPPFKGRRFPEMSNPVWFQRDPRLAWGFFGHRMDLYRHAKPHQGFEILLRWAEKKTGGYFVFTSNVDGHFQRAGFAADRIAECHGALTHLQCVSPCSYDIWSAEGTTVDVEMETIRCTSAMPECPRCNGLARPNVLMFGDGKWIDRRSEQQFARYGQWLKHTKGMRLAIVEIGAGTAVPTVRYQCEAQVGTLIRINPRDSHVPGGGIPLPLGGLEALEALDSLM